MSQDALKTNVKLSEGEVAPQFSLPSHHGEVCSLGNYARQKHVVIYFYPKDDTPGCTTEAKAFRDMAKDFDQAGAIIFGVSKDSIDSHCKFADKFALNFHLLSDEHADVCERYGVWVEKNMYGKKYMGIQRATFLISRDGEIARIWPKVKVEGHAEEVLEALRSL